MAGEGRFVVGGISLVIGAFSLGGIDFVTGAVFLILGVVLVLWGFQAREAPQEERYRMANPAPQLPTAPLTGEVPSSQYCPVCRKPNWGGAKYCQHCAAPLGTSP